MGSSLTTTSTTWPSGEPSSVSASAPVTAIWTGCRPTPTCGAAAPGGLGHLELGVEDVGADRDRRGRSPAERVGGPCQGARRDEASRHPAHRDRLVDLLRPQQLAGGDVADRDRDGPQRPVLV